jgi:glycosyltransferase 2 family protein
MKLGWRGVVGLVLSVALLVWTLRDVRPSEVWRVLQGSNQLLFLLSAIAATVIFPIRAWRWRYILEPVAPHVPFGSLWRATAVGMMVNNVVPARAGELARAFALHREQRRVTFAASIASLAVDRVFDAIVLTVLLVVSLLAPRFPRGFVVAGRPVEYYAVLAGAVALGMLVALFVVALFPERTLRIVAAVVGRIAPRHVDRVSRTLRSFTSGLGILRDPRLFAVVFWWTLVHWLVNALAFWLGFEAIGIEVPFTAALFLQSLIAFGVAVPSSPGFFGLFEAIGRVGLSVYGVDPNLAVSWAIGYHILAFIPITIIGTYYFVRMGLHFRDIGQAAPERA